MLVYTYALSPFSSAAVALLEAEGVTHKVVPLGGEWFLLGKRGSPIVTLTLTLSASVTLTLTLTLTLTSTLTLTLTLTLTRTLTLTLAGSAMRLELMERTGQSSLPHVFIGGKHVGGMFTSPPDAETGKGGGGLAALRESGELGRLVTAAQAASQA